MSFLHEDPAGVLLTLHVIPNAPKTQIIGPHGDSLKIKIHAPPVDGKANQEIICFFAELFKIPKSRVILVSGETSKAKRLRLEGLDAAEVREKIC